MKGCHIPLYGKIRLAKVAGNCTSKGPHHLPRRGLRPVPCYRPGTCSGSRPSVLAERSDPAHKMACREGEPMSSESVGAGGPFRSWAKEHTMREGETATEARGSATHASTQACMHVCHASPTGGGCPNMASGLAPHTPNPPTKHYHQTRKRWLTHSPPARFQPSVCPAAPPRRAATRRRGRARLLAK